MRYSSYRQLCENVITSQRNQVYFQKQLSQLSLVHKNSMFGNDYIILYRPNKELMDFFIGVDKGDVDYNDFHKTKSLTGVVSYELVDASLEDLITEYNQDEVYTITGAYAEKGYGALTYLSLMNYIKPSGLSPDMSKSVSKDAVKLWTKFESGELSDLVTSVEIKNSEYVTKQSGMIKHKPEDIKVIDKIYYPRIKLDLDVAKLNHKLFLKELITKSDMNADKIETILKSVVIDIMTDRIENAAYSS